jgi:hypothetical protein
MGEDEILILVVFSVLAVVGMGVTSTAGLHRLYFRHNPAPGIVRLGVMVATSWIAYVLWFHADPSVTGIYIVFYLVMGYALVKLCGQLTANILGYRTRVDVAERRNLPAAVVVAAFTLGAGLIFGGSLWGEADPVGDDEGGWWIPLGFFLLGWVTLVAVFGLYQRRDRRLPVRLRRERRLTDARAASAFLVAAALSLTDAVAGDFWGWRHGIFSFGLLAVLLLVHEAFAMWSTPDDPRRENGPPDAKRVLESTVYIVLAVIAWTASQYVDATWGGG